MSKKKVEEKTGIASTHNIRVSHETWKRLIIEKINSDAAEFDYIINEALDARKNVIEREEN